MIDYYFNYIAIDVILRGGVRGPTARSLYTPSSRGIVFFYDYIIIVYVYTYIYTFE